MSVGNFEPEFRTGIFFFVFLRFFEIQKTGLVNLISGANRAKNIHGSCVSMSLMSCLSCGRRFSQKKTKKTDQIHTKLNISVRKQKQKNKRTCLSFAQSFFQSVRPDVLLYVHVSRVHEMILMHFFFVFYVVFNIVNFVIFQKLFVVVKNENGFIVGRARAAAYRETADGPATRCCPEAQ